METVLRGGVYLNSRHPLRLNVGFLIHKDVGFSRNFDFDFDAVRVGEDLNVTSLLGSLLLTRTGQGVLINGRLQAYISLDCVRCLTSFDQHLVVSLNDHFVYPPDRASDPLLTIPESGNLELNPIVREYLLLDVPIQPLCKQDCKGLCSQCGGNLNQTDCNHLLAEVDPRFEALKSLLPKP